MSINRTNIGSLITGLALVALGTLALAGQLFRGFNFWGSVWPLFLIAVGAFFFVGMVNGGKSSAGLAIPGSIFSVVGVMLFIQNLFSYWQSWAYSWTVILMAVGLGIYIMGWHTEDPSQRQSGLGVLKVGALLFVFFGGFFEMIFDSFGISKYLFPVALILIGGYLAFVRTGVFGKQPDAPTQTIDSSIQ